MKCFYHSADLDGHCSGAIVKMVYPECELIGINYGDKFPDSQNIGEITGEMFDPSHLDQGMPMRGFLDDEKPAMPEYNPYGEYNPTDYNPNLDFDLYDSKPVTNVSYFE